MPLIRRDGSYVGTLCALDPNPAELSDEDFEIFTLLSQLIAFELEADEEQQRRETALRTMEDFVAIAAHDLRQPLAALNIQAQLLARRFRRGVAPDELRAGAEQLVTQSERAIVLSNTLLDLARIESGGLTIVPEPFDLRVLLDAVLDDVRRTAPDHRFELDSPDEVPLVGDAQRLEQVARNLVDNAVKYAQPDHGPVRIRIVREPGKDGDERLRVSVRDHGRGVPDQELARLFERRYRTQAAAEGSAEGTGLGLYIARGIVKAHNGHIWAENAPGGGLAVCLTLPVTQDELAETADLES